MAVDVVASDSERPETPEIIEAESSLPDFFAFLADFAFPFPFALSFFFSGGS